MFTPDKLLEIHYAKIESDDHWDRQEARAALQAADWMTRNKITELPFIGNFGTPYPSGTKVRIKAGAVVWSTHPQHKTRTTARAYVVTIRKADGGYFGCAGYPDRNPEVTWAGTGGYWHFVNLQDVELVSLPKTKKEPTTTAVDEGTLP